MAGHTFDVVARGYDRKQVDAWIRQAENGGPVSPPQFVIRLRGYAPAQVEQRVAQLTAGH